MLAAIGVKDVEALFDEVPAQLRDVDLAEVPDAGPVTHREWLTVARKVRTC